MILMAAPARLRASAAGAVAAPLLPRQRRRFRLPRPGRSAPRLRWPGHRLLPLPLLALLAGCGAPGGPSPAAAGRPRLQVVTTVLPITLFTRAVAGSCATVTPLIPANTNPHHFQARPGDLAALRRARVLVKNGLGLETFLDGLLAAAGPQHLQVVDASRGIPALAAPGHGHGHGHAHPTEHGPGHGAVNPHIWLDPLRAVQQLEAIRAGLVQADPGCAAGYKRRAAAYIAQLRQLHAELAAQLRPYRGRSFAAFHNFAPYFSQRYGLKADYLVDVPEFNPSPADLQRVAVAVRRSQLRALVTEPQQGNRSFQALAADLGVKISVFDPLETASEPASRDPSTYLQVMRRNGAALREAFGG